MKGCVEPQHSRERMPVTSPQLPKVDVSNLRCLAFDAVGTLIFAEPSVAKVYASVGQRFGSKMTADEIGPRFREALCRADAEAERWFGELGRTNEEYERDFWRRMVREVLPDASEPERCFETLFEHFAQPTSWRCFEDVDVTLTELQKRGYRVLIASNFDARLHSVCDGLHELRDVRTRVISSLVGYRKTHPGFYAAVVDAAECAVSEVLMIGDDFENDVLSAQKAGIEAVHLRRDSLATATASLPPLSLPQWSRASVLRAESSVVQKPASHRDKLGGGVEIKTLSDLLEWLP
jgi:putative hydrolase of the HAD superfamily